MPNTISQKRKEIENTKLLINQVWPTDCNRNDELNAVEHNNADLYTSRGWWPENKYPF